MNPTLALLFSLAADGGAPDGGVPPPVARTEELTVVGTRESRTAGSAHVLRTKDLERLNQDNPEAVVKSVPGVYTRGEDGVGLRPNIGIRGTSPDRSKKVTLMEDGVLFGPAPYSAPAAYYFPLITRMELVRVVKGPGAVSFGPQTVGGALDLVTRRVPERETGGLDLAGGQYGYGKLHGHFGAASERAGFVLEGVHLRSDGWKDLGGGGDTGYARNEWMWKGRYRLPADRRHEVGLKLGYSDERSDETYLGLTDADFRATPLRRYRASALDEMEWRRTQLVATYRGELADALTLDLAAYRHDLDRTWTKLNRIGRSGPTTPEQLRTTSIADVLANPNTPRNQIFMGVLTGAMDSTGGDDTLFIGPNHRAFVAEGVQATASLRGSTGPISHRLEVGARWHYDRIERQHSEQGYLMRGGRLAPDGYAPLVTANARAWAHAVALHATDALAWGPLTLTPGLRVELISTRLRDRLAAREAEGAPQRVLIPGVGAYWALTPGLGLLAGAYRGFSPAAPGQPAAVEPETSVNYEAGARLRQGWLRLEAIGFFNDYRNLTSVCTFASGCASEQVDTQYDAGRARIWGAETFALADVPLGRGLVLPFTGAYTFTRTELREAFVSEDPTLGQVEAGDELPYVPRHQAAVTTGLEHRRGGLAVGATYVSAMRESAGQGPTPAGESTDESLLVDVTARVNIGARGEVYLNVRNLFDAEDLVSRRPFGARPVAPRWLQLGTRWRL